MAERHSGGGGGGKRREGARVPCVPAKPEPVYISKPKVHSLTLSFSRTMKPVEKGKF